MLYRKNFKIIKHVLLLFNNIGYSVLLVFFLFFYSFD
jgi:hypothetical protein